MSVIAIGDIHGSSSQLQVLLAEKHLFKDRSTVFLGDYVDVGPNSKDVIAQLIEYKAESQRSIFLLGNHEHEMLSFLSGSSFERYAKRGGMPTIKSYAGEVHGDVHQAFVASVPRSHVEFLQSLATFYETASYLFSHCGYPVQQPDDRSLKAMVLESHQELFAPHIRATPVTVCGHYFQRTQTPYISDSVVCIDTGCGILGGPLTACLLPEKQVVQILPDLSIRIAAPWVGR